MATSFSGGCACRAVRYECTAEPLVSWTCHCRDCQRASGSAFCALLYVPQAALTSTGASKEHTVTAPSGRTVSRGFCAECGSPVFLKAGVWPGIIGVWAASLDDPSWYRPQAAIWTASAQPWDTLNLTIRQFRQGPEEDFLNELQLPAVPHG
jgi:hypothetical protein